MALVVVGAGALAGVPAAGAVSAADAVPVAGPVPVADPVSVAGRVSVAGPVVLGAMPCPDEPCFEVDGFPSGDDGTERIPESVGYTGVRIQLSSASRRELTVTGWTTPGTAQAGWDFRGVSGDLLIRPGQTATSLEIQVYDDKECEADETFGYALVKASDGTIVDPRAEFLIVDDDCAVQ